MGEFIEARQLGYSVFGVKQCDYTVDGQKKCTYGDAVSRVAFRRANAIENTLKAYVHSVKLRQQKLNKLSQALSAIASAAAKFAPDAETTASVSSEDLRMAKAILDEYGVESSQISGNSVKKSGIQILQTNVQYALDAEDNNLQQDMVTMQSFVSKRDSAIQLASTLTKKVDNTSKSGINNIR